MKVYMTPKHMTESKARIASKTGPQSTLEGTLGWDLISLYSIKG